MGDRRSSLLRLTGGGWERLGGRARARPGSPVTRPEGGERRDACLPRSRVRACRHRAGRGPRAVAPPRGPPPSPPDAGPAPAMTASEPAACGDDEPPDGDGQAGLAGRGLSAELWLLLELSGLCAFA